MPSTPVCSRRCASTPPSRPADAGPYALAGSVVLETVDPERLLGEERNFGGNLRLSYGDNGETFQRALTLAGRSGGLSVLGYAKRATGEDYVTGDGDTMGGTAADLDSLLGKIAYESESGHRIEVSGPAAARRHAAPVPGQFRRR